MKEAEAGNEIVKISYKTGDYIGEVVDRDDRRALVKALAVLQHPTQGDLHSSCDPDAPIFHERRALAYTEKVWVPLATVKPYTGTIPDYRESLRAALDGERERIDRLKRWAERCLGNLDTLRKDYGM
ncbi:kinase [Cohnella sp. CIP 111063]|jgi:Kinase associated protein B.|uniref:kinase-associated lipoprotein B n=1 Tax=unclassified Cohnella TaxID=2636738 RepID=UPI000B8C52CA|nr:MULTISPECIES: kinase-associated lipoprotein B [unclassified Cohnella]OXS61650.1 kinase [Cohnella sp. CIP 111063]PRX74070.1 kinase-associated protein B [Cohnella sp. SGD-V74]